MQALDSTTIQKIIRSELPESKKISFIEHGYNHLIAEVDKKYIFRSPKTKDGFLLFPFEQQLLKKLGGMQTLQIPEPIKTSPDPLYTISTYVPGEHLANKEIRAFGETVQKTVGAQLADFILELNQKLTVKEVREMRTLVKGLPGAWDVYFEKVFSIPQENLQLDALNQHYYAKWQDIAESTPIVIHDDLHPANLLFKNGQLTGVLDIEQVNVGTIEQELRNLYRLSEEVLLAAARQYEEETKQTVDVVAVKTWAITVELAALSRQINKGDIQHPSYIRAEAKLRYWLGDLFPL